MATSTIYVTAPSGEAQALAQTIVTERFAACANILPNGTSVYHWNGVVESETETIILFKASDNVVEAACKRIKELHSYDVPCIVVMAHNFADSDYQQWISSECQNFQT